MVIERERFRYQRMVNQIEWAAPLLGWREADTAPGGINLDPRSRADTRAKPKYGLSGGQK